MSASEFYSTDIINRAYTAKKLLDLCYLINSQVTDVYQSRGMIFPVICSSTLLHLGMTGVASVTEIAKFLEHPHQTIAQHLATLQKLGIVEKQPDKKDKRRIEFRLSEIGNVQFELLKAYNEDAARVFTDLNDTLGVDLGKALDSGLEALKQRDMSERFEALKT